MLIKALLITVITVDRDKDVGAGIDVLECRCIIYTSGKTNISSG